MMSGMTGFQRFDDKTVLGSVPNFAFSLADRRTDVVMQITFNEVVAGLAGHEVVTTLSRFVQRVADIIELFDA